MRTINFLTSHFIPENTACTNRVISFVKELSKEYQINVVCLTEKGSFQEHSHVIYDDHINIYYVNQEVFNGKNFFKRAFYEIFYLLKLVRKSNALRCDMVMATTPYMFMIPIVGMMVKDPKVLDIRDLTWEYLDEKNFVKKMIKNTLKTIMKFGIKRFDHITVSNDYEFQLLCDQYAVEEKKIDIIPNGIEKERYEKLSSITINNNNPISVIYVGNIGLAQNLEVLVDAAKRLPEIKFLIIGDGIEMSVIRRHIIENKVNNIKMTGKIPWYELEKYYKNSTILYAQLDEKFVSAMPSKLYEYAAIGLPIIYGGVGQAVSFINKLEHAIVVRPNNVDELVKAVTEMKDSLLVISEYNRNLIKENYLRESSSTKVQQIINGFLK